jgi:hypothetical protein
MCSGLSFMNSDQRFVCSGKTLVCSGQSLAWTGEMAACSGEGFAWTGKTLVCSGKSSFSPVEMSFCSGKCPFRSGKWMFLTGKLLFPTGKLFICSGHRLAWPGKRAFWPGFFVLCWRQSRVFSFLLKSAIVNPCSIFGWCHAQHARASQEGSSFPPQPPTPKGATPPQERKLSCPTGTHRQFLKLITYNFSLFRLHSSLFTFHFFSRVCVGH